jgi:hypothetical protein
MKEQTMVGRKKTKKQRDADAKVKKQIADHFGGADNVPTRNDFIHANLARSLQEVLTGQTEFEGEKNMIAAIIDGLEKHGSDDRIHRRIQPMRLYSDTLERMIRIRAEGQAAALDGFASLVEDLEVITGGDTSVKAIHAALDVLEGSQGRPN